MTTALGLIVIGSFAALLHAQDVDPHPAAAMIRTVAAQQADIYVSPIGRDTNTGLAPDQALATIEKARDLARTRKILYKDLGNGPLVIELAAGEYERSAPLELTAEDSGTADVPIVYRAAKGADVRILGGKRVKEWTPVTDPAVLARLDPVARDKVRQADLKSLGIANPGITRDGGTRLVYLDKALTLARYPNDGTLQVGDLKGGQPLVDVNGAKGDKVGKFTYDDDRVARWTGDKNVWLHGYWFWDWSDGRQAIESIDPQTRTITLARPEHTYGYRKGTPYYAYNAVSEIDQPGEYAINAQAGVAYLWPTDAMKEESPVIASTPTLFVLKGASHVVIAGLTLEHCTADAMKIEGGSDNLVVGCTIRHTGGYGVKVTGGARHGVSSSNLYATGRGGVYLVGGDRATLTRADHFADNNHIHHYATWVETYQPAVHLGGVGCVASHNLIHDAPHQAIAFEGNDHLMEFNAIERVCLKSNDAGAIYSGRNWTWRGTVIRHNFFRDIYGRDRHFAIAVYLDDLLSGITVEGNIFRDLRQAMFIGGGRDNVVANNIFIHCDPAVHVDSRGTNWAAFSINETMIPRLKEMPYQNDLWRTRYPTLPNILNDRPAEPIGNRVTRNICIGGRWLNLADKLTDKTVTLEQNFVDGAPNLVDPDRGDYSLRTDSPALKAGFKPIPFERIGLYVNEFRAMATAR